ncbi:hypothetical protein BZA70DRAFT_273704 [Myxozyma melibiosi]|uniref:PWWP domain-containing protein n=1 Tax=Myxozyma melibiosi TaxID=54550 RepID=A0ABR1FFX3_9ASCO
MWASRGDLKTLTTEQIKKYIETTAKGAKKDKALVTAYKIALEPPALEEFAKGSDDEASEDEAEADGKEDEDTKMEDAPDGDEKEKKGAATKKRKSAPIKDGDANGSTKKRKSSITKGNGEAAAKNGEKKPRAKKEASATKKKEAATAAAVKETRDEQTKHVLFLRHKLQKVFMTKDKPPQEEDMESMDKLFGKLENFQGLDLAMIRSTKINKVLKAIAKMTSIPLEPKYEFKSRSQKLLDAWNAKFDLGSPAPTQPPTDGKSEPKQEASEEKKDAPEEKKEAPEAKKVEEKKEEEKKDEEKKDEKKEEAEKSEPKATPAAVPEVAADAAAEKEPVKTEAPVAEAGA